MAIQDFVFGKSRPISEPSNQQSAQTVVFETIEIAEKRSWVSSEAVSEDFRVGASC